jgi:bifunctional ADP-heptose synthase (sugar kinase/adenylyltransferase)
VGALAVALAAGIGPAEAVTAAAAAAAAAVTRQGTQTGMPRPADVHAATGYRWPVPAAKLEAKPTLLPTKVNRRLTVDEHNYR